MNCREFLNEFEERNVLTETATLHLKTCPGCKKTSGEQIRVWQMIDGLNQVSAPKDFDFRVKARIANAQPADYQPKFFPFLRYVMPLGVIALLFGVIAFNANYFTGDNTPQMTQNISPTSIEQATVPNDSSIGGQLVAANTQSFTEKKPAATIEKKPSVNFPTTAPPLTAERKNDKTVPVEPPTVMPKERIRDGGSRDIAVSRPRVKLPAGIPIQSVETSPNDDNYKSLTDEQILSETGVEITLQNQYRVVKSVKQNSLAERSGVKVGDVIEALDGRKISDKPMRFKTSELKKIRVLRGTEKIEISLKN